jgi:undecaprenyl phosphate N,N'-diacetylbacillosamine 1-phosphate transferase
MNHSFLFYRDLVKPLFDYFVSLVILIVFSPLFLVLIILLAIVNKGKPFFLQSRTGKGEREFFVIKFKTMNDRKDKDGNLLPDVDRLTRVGNFIRKSSLDELPQLLNVLKGDMSIIGPRPFISQYLPLYSAVQRQRFKVKPGITGWAQVNGRNTISWTKRLEYDVYYAEQISFGLDFKIFILTIGKLFNHDPR